MTDASHVVTDTVGAFVGPPQVLLRGPGHGPLADTTVAVKDVIDVAGSVTGAGNPTFALGREPATDTAPAVAALVAAGATVVGKTITDELAYSLSGTNVHHGIPTNPAAPGRVPGGSSAGSAAAVAARVVDLGVGTDTGGSIRVPASYCGIVGWRPSHGAIDPTGIVHLARSFDTIGLLARDIRLLARAAEVLLGDAAMTSPITSAVFATELLDRVDDACRASVIAASDADVESLGIDLTSYATAFRSIQGREAWTEHGRWISEVKPAMGPGITDRFAAAAAVTDTEVASGEKIRAAARAVVADATAGGRVLLGPAAAGAAPLLDQALQERAPTRARTLELTCLAGLAGAPVVVLPLARDGDLPLGVAALGAPGSDLALLAWAVELMTASRDRRRRG